jgi:D-glycero-D-manno-heptose 1,7-bisphosphate phosphatase
MKALFFDRDGILNEAVVINNKPYPPSSKKLVIIPQSIRDLTEFFINDYLLIGITNQPDVARGTQNKLVVEEINCYLKYELNLTDIFTCYHDDKDNCNCRKPKPGMILQAQKIYDIDLANSFLVGDRWRDVECGRNASVKTIFVNFNYNEKKPEADFTVNEISSIKNIILQHGG